MDTADKNKRIEEALNSLDGMQRAEPSPFLYGKIANRISGRGTNIKLVPLRTVYLTAACVLLLVLCNVLLLSKRNITTTDKAIQEVAEYYQLTNNNPLYSL